MIWGQIYAQLPHFQLLTPNGTSDNTWSCALDFSPYKTSAVDNSLWQQTQPITEAENMRETHANAESILIHTLDIHCRKGKAYEKG